MYRKKSRVREVGDQGISTNPHVLWRASPLAARFFHARAVSNFVPVTIGLRWCVRGRYPTCSCVTLGVQLLLHNSVFEKDPDTSSSDWSGLSFLPCNQAVGKLLFVAEGTDTHVPYLDRMDHMVEEDVPRSIHDICEEGHEEEVMRLLDVDPGLVHVRNGYGSSPLLGCAWGGHLGLVKLLLCKVGGHVCRCKS